MPSARQRFVEYVRRAPGARPLVSPFLPKPGLVDRTLDYLGLPTDGGAVSNEIRLAQALDYEPMFMTAFESLVFPAAMIYHASDYPDAFLRSMEAIYHASCTVFDIAMQEGIDFMSESGYGLEMISPAQFAAQDVLYTRRLADWTHEREGLFWYHNCGQTRELIRDGQFDRLGAEVIETIAPPPEGDNDLGESRRHLAATICSKGNLSLGLMRNGTVEDVVEATRKMILAVQGYAHIHSTADAVYAETPPENFVAFVRTARQEAERLT